MMPLYDSPIDAFLALQEHVEVQSGYTLTPEEIEDMAEEIVDMYPDHYALRERK